MPEPKVTPPSARRSRYEHSYRKLFTDLQDLVQAEVRTIREARGWFLAFILLLLPINIVLFIPLALISLIFWPLGKLREGVTVGIFLGMMVPVFQFILSLSICHDIEVKMSVRVFDDRIGKPMANTEVIVNPGGRMTTDAQGYLEFTFPLSVPRFFDRTLGRQYCPDCFEKHHFYFSVDYEIIGYDIEVVRTFEFSKWYKDGSVIEFLEDEGKTIPLKDIHFNSIPQ